jgi:hypothetical protein
MSLSDFNPMVLLLLCLISVGAFGMMVGALRRASLGRYDIRDEER